MFLSCRKVWCLLVLVWLCLGVGGLSDREDCERLFDTPSQRAYVCLEHPDLVTALQIAEKVGRRECQSSFQSERWNCSGFSILKAPNITSMATKEAAYVHALSLAAIAHSVAKVCALGDASSCTCNEADLVLPERGSTQYELGCSDNVEFGLHFARNFLLKRHSTGEVNQVQREVKQHNMMIGAQVVQETMSGTAKTCKCIGISGSCTMQSCQYDFPDFSALGKEILTVYHKHTCRASTESQRLEDNDPVTVTESPDTRPSAIPDACSQQSDGKKLLFTRDSPNYCIRNELFGSVGTVGRECDPHSTGHSSCDYLCRQCGRGHTNIAQSYNETCYCNFTYCCEIQCHKCPRTREVSICL